MTWGDVVELWLKAGADYRVRTEAALRGLPCVYCGDSAQTLDHIVPRSTGGPNDPANLVPVCRSCNGAKSALSLEEWARRIRLELARMDRRQRQLRGLQHVLGLQEAGVEQIGWVMYAGEPAAARRTLTAREEAELDAALDRVPVPDQAA